MAVAPLYVGDGVLVREAQLWPVVHVAQSLELRAPSRQPVVNKPSFVIFLFLCVAPTGVDVSTGRGRAQRAEASHRRPRALHAPDVGGVRRERLTVVVGLPDDPSHVALKVHVGAGPLVAGVSATSRVARLHFPAGQSGVVGVGCVAAAAAAAAAAC